jgi:hypothetical protein
LVLNGTFQTSGNVRFFVAVGGTSDMAGMGQIRRY